MNAPTSRPATARNLIFVCLFLLGTILGCCLISLCCVAALLIIPSHTSSTAPNQCYLPFVTCNDPTSLTNPPTPTIIFTATSTITSTLQITDTPGPPPCTCDSDQYNCSDFKLHSEAQACYNYCISQGKGDIHNLDRDGNGIVCESLP